MDLFDDTETNPVVTNTSAKKKDQMKSSNSSVSPLKNPEEVSQTKDPVGSQNMSGGGSSFPNKFAQPFNQGNPNQATGNNPNFLQQKNQLFSGVFPTAPLNTPQIFGKIGASSQPSPNVSHSGSKNNSIANIGQKPFHPPDLHPVKNPSTPHPADSQNKLNETGSSPEKNNLMNQPSGFPPQGTGNFNPASVTPPNLGNFAKAPDNSEAKNHKDMSGGSNVGPAGQTGNKFGTVIPGIPPGIGNTKPGPSHPIESKSIIPNQVPQNPAPALSQVPQNPAPALSQVPQNPAPALSQVPQNPAPALSQVPQNPASVISQVLPFPINNPLPAPNPNPPKNEFKISSSQFIQEKSPLNEISKQQSHIEGHNLNSSISLNQSNIYPGIPNFNPKNSTLVIPKGNLISIVKIKNEDKINITTSIIEILVNNLDYNEIIKNHQTIIKTFEKNVKLGSSESKMVLDYIKSTLKCKKCDKNEVSRLVELKCNDILCLSCLERELEKNIDKDILNCPICTKQIDNREESMIWTKLGLDFQKKTREKLEQKYASEKQLKCSNCKKLKKNFNKTSCLHVCKECFAEELRKNYVPCSECHQFINYDLLKNETFQCRSCKSISYFVGSYGKYVQNENIILCLSCTYSFFNSGYDSSLNIRLSKAERIEINDHLFAHCVSCKSEIFKEYLRRGECGHYSICNNCSGNYACNECQSYKIIE